ncbi:alpha/beta hydrolase [Myroides odoratimimus]|uniref:alpha/beta hydrolase n=1 Tax=Myroides odoratimimus TaxID=76832 RepID=UPI00310119E0
MMKFYINIFILLFLSTNVLSQDLSMNGHIIKAKKSTEEYQLYVSLPTTYNVEDNQRYPVLFLLDAYYSYPLVSSLHKLLEAGQEIEEIIIVAIGDKNQSSSTWYKNRMINYTPSNDPNVDQEIAEGLGISISEVKTGKANEFLQCIREDIIPFIDSTYKTTKDRGISGHSVAGLFTVYSFIYGYDLFNKYGINSPSLFWNNNEVIDKMEVFIKTNKSLEADLFISYGALEPEIISSSVQSFLSVLNQHKNKRLSIKAKVFEEETHTSVVSTSLTRTLKVLYGK